MISEVPESPLLLTISRSDVNSHAPMETGFSGLQKGKCLRIWPAESSKE